MTCVTLDARGLETIEKMRRESLTWDRKKLHAELDGLPDSIVISHDRSDDPPTVIELLNLGWPVYKLVDDGGMAWFAMTNSFRALAGASEAQAQ